MAEAVDELAKVVEEEEEEEEDDDVDEKVPWDGLPYTAC